MEKALIARTSAHLRDLLVRSPYAERWAAHIDRRQPHQIHQSGVCHVLADYLWANGLHTDTSEELARKLKDRVYRALAGQSLSRATVRWFIEAFEMSPEDAAELVRLSTAQRGAETILGGLSLSPGTLPPQRHETVSLSDWHTIGPDGLPESHRTVHVIRAREPMDRYPYLFDTDAASVSVMRGGHAGAAYALGNGLFGVDIELPQPLAAGQTHVLEFVTEFWYRTPPPQELRRAATGRIDNVDLRVQFHHLRLPQQVWWSVWDALDGEPVRSEVVELAPDKVVRRSLDAIEATIVGFRWDIARLGAVSGRR
ncbi:MAG: hypothetical protein HZY73_16155 [Micropruina sp.]|nr:MAG: hypothetical protein HZY73_16155 [Micropruina sp.]